MKVCVFCESVVDDSATSCPNCSANRFKNKCPVCGNVYEGQPCPTCQANNRAAQEAAEQERLKAEAVEKANSGLGWKTALTFIMPYVGGYFLVNDNVRTGFRVFGIVWCSIFAISASSLGGNTVLQILSALVCFLPVLIYAAKKKPWKWNELDSHSKPLAIAVAAILLIIVVFAIMSGGTPRNQGATTSAGSSSVVASSSVAETTLEASSSAAEEAEAEAEAQAEAEARAQEEAEAQAKAEAEAEAKAKAEAEAQAKAEAEAKKKEEAAAKKKAEKQQKIDDLEAYFPQADAYKAATVALTNSLAADVFSPDMPDAANLELFHSYSDHSGYYLKPMSDGKWSYKDESTWHVDGLEYGASASEDTRIGASLDVSFDGSNYTVSNVKGKQYVPGNSLGGMSLDNWETESGVSEAFTVSPDLLS